MTHSFFPWLRVAFGGDSAEKCKATPRQVENINVGFVSLVDTGLSVSRRNFGVRRKVL